MAVYNTYTDKQLVPRVCDDQVVRSVRIKAGTGVLAKGQVLGRLSASPNQFAKYNNANSNGTETAVCVLLDPVDASGSDDVNGLALFCGLVIESALVGIDTPGKTDLSAKTVAPDELMIRGGY